MRKLLAALLLGAVAAAPSQRVAETSAATFKVGTKLVEVDVVARGKHGPAAGLNKDDFTLLDNGQPQDIAFFSVRAVRGAAAAGPVSSSPPLPDGVVSNRPSRAEEAPATQTVLLLDRLFTSPLNQIMAIQRIARFLELRRKQDGIGIYTLGGSVQVMQDVTSDDRLLRRAASSLKAGDVVGRNSDTTGMTEKAAGAYSQLNMDERVGSLKRALQAIARHLATVPGRKNVVWISEAFPVFYCPPHLPCKDYTPDMQAAAQALNDANVALYAVDPRGLIGALGRMTGISNAEGRGPASPIVPGYVGLPPVGPEHVETMNLLAGLTGGLAYYNTNGLEDSMLAAVKDGDVTYSLGFYPAEESQDGKVHKLSVKVAEAGVRLRYRENYFATKPESEAEDRPSLEQLIKDPLDATQIGLLAKAAPDGERPGVFNVRVNVDLHDIRLSNQEGKWVGAVEVSFHLENSNSFQVVTRSIEVPEDQLSKALGEGIIVDHSIEWRGKATALRVVVEDKGTGAAGSLRIPLGGK